MTLAKLRPHRSQFRWSIFIPALLGAAGAAYAAYVVVVQRRLYALPGTGDTRPSYDGVTHAGGDRKQASVYTKSEQSVMGDGQLGGGSLSRHPDDVNPEGAYYLSNAESRQGKRPH